MAGPQAGGDRTLLVMLPGAHLRARDFADQGFAEALHLRHRRVDLIAGGLVHDDYLAGEVAALLHERVIGPAMARGYARLWLMGISLGGLGALLYARERPASVDGLILLAPFFATRGAIAEVVAAGGLAGWEPGTSTSAAAERDRLAWLASRPFAAAGQPRLYLGYGRGDRYAPASRVLADSLPGERVVVAEGGHDWPTWACLWRRILAIAPLDTQGMNQARE